MNSPVLAFDVNETLLDLSVLDPLFEHSFGDRSIRQLWFGQMLQLSFVGIITDAYVDFTTAQHAALEMIAERLSVRLAASAAEEIIEGMRALPAHPEVPAALDALRAAGVRMCTITNSPLDVARAQVQFAGITR